MEKSSSQLTRPAKLLAVAAVVFSVCGFVGTMQGAEPAFDGGKSTWHDGFVRYDSTMDDETLAITPFTRPDKEGFEVGTPAKGQRRCIVVVPNKPAPGNPWSWRGCYWDHQPQAEVELLHRGFYIAFITPDPGKQWDAWYAYLTEKHELSKKPAFVGMSKGGVNEYTWTTSNPDKVSCIYADNPGIYPEDILRLGELIKHDVPLLNVCGTLDFVLKKNTKVIENIYHQGGGRISVMIKEGTGHHPHSLIDPKPIADFIEQHVEQKTSPRPEIVDDTFTKSGGSKLDAANLLRFSSGLLRFLRSCAGFLPPTGIELSNGATCFTGCGTLTFSYGAETGPRTSGQRESNSRNPKCVSFSTSPDPGVIRRCKRTSAIAQEFGHPGSES